MAKALSSQIAPYLLRRTKAQVTRNDPGKTQSESEEAEGGAKLKGAV